jgi:hypothetical protein
MDLDKEEPIHELSDANPPQATPTAGIISSAPPGTLLPSLRTAGKAAPAPNEKSSLSLPEDASAVVAICKHCTQRVLWTPSLQWWEHRLVCSAQPPATATAHRRLEYFIRRRDSLHPTANQPQPPGPSTGPSASVPNLDEEELHPPFQMAYTTVGPPTGSIIHDFRVIVEGIHYKVCPECGPVPGNDHVDINASHLRFSLFVASKRKSPPSSPARDFAITRVLQDLEATQFFRGTSDMTIILATLVRAYRAPESAQQHSSTDAYTWLRQNITPSSNSELPPDAASHFRDSLALRLGSTVIDPSHLPAGETVILWSHQDVTTISCLGPTARHLVTLLSQQQCMDLNLPFYEHAHTHPARYSAFGYADLPFRNPDGAITHTLRLIIDYSERYTSNVVSVYQVVSDTDWTYLSDQGLLQAPDGATWALHDMTSNNDPDHVFHPSHRSAIKQMTFSAATPTILHYAALPPVTRDIVYRGIPIVSSVSLQCAGLSIPAVQEYFDAFVFDGDPDSTKPPVPHQWRMLSGLAGTSPTYVKPPTPSLHQDVPESSKTCPFCQLKNDWHPGKSWQNHSRVCNGTEGRGLLDLTISPRVEGALGLIPAQALATVDTLLSWPESAISLSLRSLQDSNTPTLRIDAQIDRPALHNFISLRTMKAIGAEWDPSRPTPIWAIRERHPGWGRQRQLPILGTTSLRLVFNAPGIPLSWHDLPVLVFDDQGTHVTQMVVNSDFRPLELIRRAVL